jgi:hypothetical protein
MRFKTVTILNDYFLDAGRRSASKNRMTARNLIYSYDSLLKLLWNSLRRVNAKMQTGLPIAECAWRRRLIDDTFYFAGNATQDISQAGMNYRWNSRSDNKFHFSRTRNSRSQLYRPWTVYRLQRNIEILNLAAIGQRSVGEWINLNGRYRTDNRGNFDRIINNSGENDRVVRYTRAILIDNNALRFAENYW